MRALAACLMLLFLSSGCVTPGDPAVTQPQLPAIPPAAPQSFVFECPDPSAAPPEARECVGRFNDPGWTYQIYKTLFRNSTIVLIGARTDSATFLVGEPRPDPQYPGTDEARGVLVVSEDGGASWTKRFLPRIPYRVPNLLPTDYSYNFPYDAAWDQAGRLHVVGVATNQYLKAPDPGNPSPFDAFGVPVKYHLSTDDLGQHWSEPQILGDPSPEGNVRVWSQNGATGVIWSTDGALYWARSIDRGATWTAPQEIPHADCTYLGEVIFRDDAQFVCWYEDRSGRSADDPIILHLNLDTGAIGSIAPPKRLPQQCYRWYLQAAPQGLVLFADRCQSGSSGSFFVLNTETGSWSEDESITDFLSADDGADLTLVHGFATSPSGILHVLARTVRYDGPIAPPGPVGMATLTFVHAAYDLGSNALIQETVLEGKKVSVVESLALYRAGLWDVWGAAAVDGEQVFLAIALLSLDFTVAVPERDD